MMPPTAETDGFQSVLPDMISFLPEDVIADTLMRLNLRDAVRTSILAKKWRYKWCRLSQFTLDETLWEMLDNDVSLTTVLANATSHIMTFNAEPITKFTLGFYLTDSDDICTIDKLIAFLSRNGIQHLVLDFMRGIRYILPSSFFTSLQLRHLALENCSIQLPPPDFKGFDRLISLELCRVTISSKFLANLISHSLFLEKVVLRDVDFIENDTPMLRSFDFGGSCLKNAPLLAKLSLINTKFYYWKTAVGCDIARLFESFPALEYLHLNDMCMLPSAGEVPTRVPFILHSVKHLRLSGVCYFIVNNSIYQCDLAPFALCLIRSFPNLQYLEIQATNLYDDIVHPEPFDVALNHLTEVKLVDFSGTKHQMALMKLLLAKSPVLVRILVELPPFQESARVKILSGLSECKPASAKAEVAIIFRRRSVRRW